MKKFATIASLFAVLVLAACGGAETTDNDESTSPEETSVDESEVEDDVLDDSDDDEDENEIEDAGTEDDE